MLKISKWSKELSPTCLTWHHFCQILTLQWQLAIRRDCWRTSLGVLGSSTFSPRTFHIKLQNRYQDSPILPPKREHSSWSWRTLERVMLLWFGVGQTSLTLIERLGQHLMSWQEWLWFISWELLWCSWMRTLRLAQLLVGLHCHHLWLLSSTTSIALKKVSLVNRIPMSNLVNHT